MVTIIVPLKSTPAPPWWHYHAPLPLLENAFTETTNVSKSEIDIDAIIIIFVLIIIKKKIQYIIL